MSDPFESPALEPEQAAPWDAEPPPDDPDAPRQRHDAFTHAKKTVFLRALVKTGCVRDACGLTGFAPRTIYRHQEGDPRFFDHCALAIRMSATPIELTAWQRAVEGVEQEFACGGQVHVRRRYDSSLLRLLLQGSNPRKYGARPGFKRKHLLKHERKEIEREVRAEIAARDKKWTFEESMELLDKKLKALAFREEPEKLAAGWTKTADDHWIPPGFGWVGLPEGTDPPAIAVSGEDTPRESM